MRRRHVPALVRGLLILIVLGIAGWLGARWLERTYPQHLPWTPLDLTAPIGMATPLKLGRLAGDKPACLALFEATPLAIEAMDDRRTAPQCGYVDAVVLQKMTAAYAPATVRLACPLAAALAVWEQQVVQPAALRHFGTAVDTIEHYGTYSCRRLYGRDEGNWSRHATAEAIDISAFRIGGERVAVTDWPQRGTSGAFLRDVRDGGCGVFGTLLGPDYNAAHADHFHAEAAGFGTCR